MGVGKSTVCRLLKEKLPNSVYLDGDWCWDASPFVVTEETKEMVMQNICFLLNQFIRCSIYDHILFAWVMHEQSIIDDLLRRLKTEGCRVLSLSLMCDEKTLKARLAEDVRRGLRDGDILTRSAARLPLFEKLNTLKIDTVGKKPDQIADEIAATAGIAR